MKRRIFYVPAIILLLAFAIFAQQAQPAADLLTLDSIFTFRTRSLGPVQWQKDGSAYLALEPSASKREIVEIIRYDTVSGDRTIKVGLDKLTPQGGAPIAIENFVLSPDEKQILLFTKSERVWRSNTRGDYWILNLDSGALHKLGGTAKPSSLMFAKFSPDGKKVGYVRENNIYVENLDASPARITPLTNDGSRTLVNGTFDWVYEEELFCRDGFRWSPDSRHIAYWQLNSEGVKEFQLVNNTGGLYPVITSFPYPKAGETNSAARVGVVSATGGAAFRLPATHATTICRAWNGQPVRMKS
jgi:dipeptidyl-peptidase-4